MATLAASAKTMLFGDMRKYVIRRVRQMTILRLTERFADYGQVAFIGFARYDGTLLDAGTHPGKVPDPAQLTLIGYQGKKFRRGLRHSLATFPRGKSSRIRCVRAVPVERNEFSPACRAKPGPRRAVTAARPRRRNPGKGKLADGRKIILKRLSAVSQIERAYTLGEAWP